MCKSITFTSAVYLYPDIHTYACVNVYINFHKFTFLKSIKFKEQ